MVTMMTLPPAEGLKIQVVSWQNEIRTLDVLNCSTEEEEEEELCVITGGF